MCYFVEINLSRKELEKRFDIPMINDPRYMQSNLLSAFTRPFLPVITSEFPDIIQNYSWGLIPSWVKDEDTADKISNSTYNARSETIFEKASFRAAAKYKRCMVLVHGFFEYHTAGKNKIPYYIKRKDDQPFAVAGLYEKWTNPLSEHRIETVSIITTRANSLMEKIHNSKKRMPVILERKTEREYLDMQLSKNEINKYFDPFDENQMMANPISKHSFQNFKDPMDNDVLNPVAHNLSRDLFDDTI